MGELSEADPAQHKATINRARAAAFLTAMIVAHLELLLAGAFQYECFSGHLMIPYVLKASSIF
jgi:hypothetical protein